MPVIPRIFGGPQTQTVAAIYNDSFTYTNGSFLLDHYPWAVLPASLLLRNVAIINPSPWMCLHDGLTIVANQLVISNAGAGGVIAQPRSFITPLPFWGPLLDGLKQFSEYKIISDNSIGGGQLIHCGPAVMCRQGTGATGFNAYATDCYVLQINANLLQMALYRGIGSGGTNANTLLIAGGGSMVFAMGDTLRIEVTPSATDNFVEVKRNGVSVATFTDNNAARCVGGVPGIAFMYQDSNAFFQTIDDYSGGPL